LDMESAESDSDRRGPRDSNEGLQQPSELAR